MPLLASRNAGAITLSCRWQACVCHATFDGTQGNTLAQQPLGPHDQATTGGACWLEPCSRSSILPLAAVRPRLSALLMWPGHLLVTLPDHSHLLVTLPDHSHWRHQAGGFVEICNTNLMGFVWAHVQRHAPLLSPLY